MEFRTRQAQDRYDGLVAVAHDVLVGLDFDGTLSPIVEDPAQAVIHPEAPGVLDRARRPGARRRGDHRPARPAGRRARRPRGASPTGSPTAPGWW